MARQMYMQGVRYGDMVINSWAYGLHNGAFIYDEALHKWLNCVVITASTGNVTASRRQVELAIDYRANAILTTGDYLLRLADAAREYGYDPKTDFSLTSIPNPGDRRLLEETFGLPYYATYGIHEVQSVACECPVHDGLHIYEDAFIVQVVHPETGEPLPDGELGSLCVTEVYKTGSPQFRYQSMDLSYLYPPGRCACGSWLRRIAPFAGRGDNMVKLRGINVWPEALGELAMEIDSVTSDFFVRAIRQDNRDELVLMVVSEADGTAHPAVAGRVESLLKDRLGVRIAVEAVPYGALDDLTEVHTSPKPKRFRDERGKG
jgi:phenylacetate-CoA ligase